MTTTGTHHPEILDQLAAGIANLTSSRQWRHYLDFQSRFHHYSFGNVLLIASQCPGATRVAGFHAWRKLNRTVRKGEKALWILAPMMRRRSDTDGEDERTVWGFKFVPVFDIDQTDGEELPSVCVRLDGDDPAGRLDQLREVARSIGFTVMDHEFSGGTNGDCSHELHRIRVETANSPAQRVKTLAHELAHALLHEQFGDRALAELEAESTAYVICQALGIDTSGYSFGYVATWAGGGDPAIASIKGSCDRIQKTAAAILGSIDVVGQEQGVEALSSAETIRATLTSGGTHSADIAGTTPRGPPGTAGLDSAGPPVHNQLIS
jgi:antirestriction protein ArdC